MSMQKSELISYIPFKNKLRQTPLPQEARIAGKYQNFALALIPSLWYIVLAVIPSRQAGRGWKTPQGGK